MLGYADAGHVGGYYAELATDFSRGVRFWIESVEVAGTAELEKQDHAASRRLARTLSRLTLHLQKLRQAEAAQPERADLQHAPTAEPALQKIGASAIPRR